MRIVAWTVNGIRDRADLQAGGQELVLCGDINITRPTVAARAWGCVVQPEGGLRTGRMTALLGHPQPIGLHHPLVQPHALRRGVAFRRDLEHETHSGPRPDPEHRLPCATALIA